MSRACDKLSNSENPLQKNAHPELFISPAVDEHSCKLHRAGIWSEMLTAAQCYTAPRRELAAFLMVIFSFNCGYGRLVNSYCLQVSQAQAHNQKLPVA